MRAALDILVYALFYGLTWTLAMLPRWVVYGISDVNAFLLRYVLRYRRSVVFDNLRRSFPEKHRREIRGIAWRFYRHLSDLLVESAFLMHASPQRMMRRFECKNLEILDKPFEEGRSVVVAASHYGNWEFHTLVACQIDHQMLAIYKAIKNKSVERLITRSRERMGSVVVEMRRTLRTVVEFERRGIPVLVGLISDQTPSNVYHYWGKFLNQETLVYRGVEQIAKRFDMPVYFGDARKERRGFYSLRLELITENPRETPDDWITAQHLAALERVIVEKPEYWLWSHRRWKRSRPVTETEAL